MAAKKIDVGIGKNGEVVVDLGGEWDNGCCGAEAGRFNQKLEELGICLSLEGILCRLSVPERIQAKLKNECNTGIVDAMTVPHRITFHLEKGG